MNGNFVQATVYEPLQLNTTLETRANAKMGAIINSQSGAGIGTAQKIMQSVSPQMQEEQIIQLVLLLGELGSLNDLS